MNEQQKLTYGWINDQKRTDNKPKINEQMKNG